MNHISGCPAYSGAGACNCGAGSTRTEAQARRRVTVADAFVAGRATDEAEALFQKQLRAEEQGLEGCYFCGSHEHRLTECPDRP